MKKIFCLLALFVLAGCLFNPRPDTMSPEAAPPSRQITLPVGLSFPPISNASGLAFTIEQMKNLDILLVRISSNWAHREPQQGYYYWDPLDERINALHESGASILFTIPASGPDWACGEKTENGTCVFQDEEAFRSYVTALMSRYRGKINKVQFGNEWDNMLRYPGTAEEFMTYTNIVYDIIQETSPGTTVVLGGLTTAYSIYISACENGEVLSFEALELKNGVNLAARIERQLCSRNDLEARVTYVLKNARYDIVDLHLYDDSENWPLYVNTLRQITDKPLIVSEFGGPSSAFERYSQEYHAQRLKQYLLTLEDLPIEEAYYFTLVDNPMTYHSRSGLFTVTRQKKNAFDMMRRMVSLVGGE